MSVQNRIKWWGLGLGVAACGLVACDSSDAGPGAGGGPTGDPAARLCPAACAAAHSCKGEQLDPTACEAQCALEVAGDGYLVKEIALEYFQLLHDAGTDPDCELTGFGPWQYDLFDPSDYALEVDEPAVLDECVAAMACYGSSLPSQQAGCFLTYYRYNLEYREPIRACFELSCLEEFDCRCAHQLAGEPWITVPRPPPDPVWPGCPPPEP